MGRRLIPGWPGPDAATVLFVADRAGHCPPTRVRTMPTCDDPYQRQALLALTSTQRQLLPEAVADCLEKLHARRVALMARLMAPQRVRMGSRMAWQPTFLEHGTAQRDLTRSIQALTHLIGEAAMPATVREMGNLDVHGDDFFSAPGSREVWKRLVQQTAREARKDLKRLRDADALRPDGPDADFPRFWWQGTPYPLPPTPARLLRVMWYRESIALESDQIASVWGQSPSGNALKTACYATNKVLTDSGYTRFLRVKAGQLLWTEPDPI
jgi:hypothetical protein